MIAWLVKRSITNLKDGVMIKSYFAAFFLGGWGGCTFTVLNATVPVTGASFDL